MSEKKTYEELASLLRDAPPVGSRWRHYKTRAVYMVVATAVSEDTQEPMVVYTPETFSAGVSFVRPLSEWRQRVRHDGETVERFAAP